MLCLEVHGVMKISQLLKMSTTTVDKYIRDFNDGGLEELLDYVKASGRPTTLSNAEQELC
jgi:transposase